MKKQITLIALIIIFGLSGNTKMLSADDFNDQTSLEENLGDVTTNKTVVRSGINGETTWEVYDNGDALIKPTSGSRGKMIGRISDLYNVTGEIIVEEGVEFPDDSTNLFKDYNTSSMVFYNSTSNVTNMTNMFRQTDTMQYLDLSRFDTSKVTSMRGMFANNGIPTLDVSSFDTSNVTDMSEMFGGTWKIKELDVSHFDTRKVTNMSSMFISDFNLKTLDLSNFDTSHVANMSSMFNGLQKIVSLNISSFDTRKVVDMKIMFRDLRKIREIYLGPETSFFDIGMTYTDEFEPPYKGNWIKENDRNIDFDNFEKLLEAYDNSLSGLYVMDRTFNVTFNYGNNSDTLLVDYRDFVNSDLIPQVDLKPNHKLYWNTQSDGSGETFDINDPVLSDMELYPIIVPVTYTVTFNNDGIISTAIVNHGELVSNSDVPSNTYKEGYIFKRWIDAKTDEEIDFSTELIESDRTFIALYKKEVDSEKPIIPSKPNEDNKTPIEEGKTPSTGIRDNSYIMITTLLTALIIFKKSKRDIKSN